MQDVTKVRIAVGDLNIEFEGSEDFVKEQLESLKKEGIRVFGIPKEAEYVKKSPKLAPSPKVREPLKAAAGTIQELLETKKPSGSIETVVVFACFLKREGKAEFTEDDIKTCYKRAKTKPPKVPSQSLRDAKNRYDYIASGSTRGTYQITDHGESFVEYDLPKKTKK